MATLILRPNGDGSELSVPNYYDGAWHTSGAGTNWPMVDEVTPDEGSTIVGDIGATPQAYKRDLYAIPDHTSEVGVINSVKIYLRIWEGTSNPTYYKPCLRTHSTTYDGTEITGDLSNVYVTHSQTWAVNPNTSAAWTWAEIDALEIGVGVEKKTNNSPVCTQLYVEVDYEVVAPTVTTQAVSDIGWKTATGNGNITNAGGENCSKRGVCWNTVGNPTVADDKSEEEGSFGTGAFTRPMTGLTPEQHYYVRAYAYNSDGYGYGAQVEFDTTEVATGDITGKAKKSIYASCYNPIGQHRGSNVFAVILNASGSGNMIIITYSVAVDGTTTVADSWDTGIRAFTWYLSHIAGDTFAIWYSSYPGTLGVIKTFAIAANGTITKSVIATHTFAPAHPNIGWLRHEPVSHGNNIWLMAMQISSPDLKVYSISISDDGATMSTVDTQGYTLPQAGRLAMSNANGSIYALISEQLESQQTIYTFEVAAGGAITAKSSLQLGTVAAGTPGMFKITDGIIFISRTTGFETRSISAAGAIGGAIDTAAAGEVRFWKYVGQNYLGDYVWCYVSADTVYTRSFTSAGIIGAVVSSYDFDIAAIGTPHLIQGADEMWSAFLPGDPTQDLWIGTFEVEGGAPYVDRIYVFLGDSAEDEGVELTDPAYSMVLSARTERGRDSELDQATSGIAELTVDNFAGDFNPENAGGQYYGQLALGKWITIFEVYLGVKYKHFTGKIDKITPNDDPNDLTAYILAVDGMDDLAGTEIKTVLRTTTETGELVGDVLDAVNWPAGKRDLDTGVDTLQVGWFHKVKALDGARVLEKTEDGRFYIDIDGDAIWENRHHRITGDGLISQHDFEDTAVKIEYEYSKRLLYNEINVSGRRYYAGGVTLFSGYDMATLDDSLVWSAHAGDVGAPYIPQGITVTLWADFNSPLASYTSLVAGTHWNANTAADKTGTNVTANITLVQTQYGQAVKLAFTNNGGVGAYLVVPNSPPSGAPAARTCLVYGVLFGTETMAITESNAASQDDYGKRSLEVDAPFMSNPNDILAHAQYLLAKYEDPVPRAISIRHVARTAWPNTTIRIQCLTRKISDRITVKSTRLAVDRDFYINKVIQDYVLQEGGMVHETTWLIERALGNAEGLFWLLGVTNFGELGVVTRLGR